jgi:hypothetical protein
MIETAWGPTKTWRWGKNDKYELSYYSKSRRLVLRWEFNISGTGASAGNPLTAIWMAWRYKKELDKQRDAWHSRPGLTPEETDKATRELNDN